MTREQRINVNVFRTIANQATEESMIEYKGKRYRTFIWNGDNATAMRIVIGENGWSVSPAEWDIEKYTKV